MTGIFERNLLAPIIREISLEISILTQSIISLPPIAHESLSMDCSRSRCLCPNIPFPQTQKSAEQWSYSRSEKHYLCMLKSILFRITSYGTRLTKSNLNPGFPIKLNLNMKAHSLDKTWLVFQVHCWTPTLHYWLRSTLLKATGEKQEKSGVPLTDREIFFGGGGVAWRKGFSGIGFP